MRRFESQAAPGDVAFSELGYPKRSRILPRYMTVIFGETYDDGVGCVAKYSAKLPIRFTVC